MKECGYRLTHEYLRGVITHRPDDESPTGMQMDAQSLATRYEKMGIEVKRERPDDLNDKGRVSPVSCAICGDISREAYNATGYIACDPEKHTAYYDALEIR
jgi:hypothetical protein